MQLRYSPPSPFARKVRVAAAHLGLPLELVLADTNSETDTLRVQNPLGKLPVLLDGDKILYDSPVILAYLDYKAGGAALIPTAPDAKFDVMRLEALCDGIMEAGLAIAYEARFRPVEIHSKPWLERQDGKIMRALKALDGNVPPVEVNAGTIALACALEYTDIRIGISWQAGHPALNAWLAAFRTACPSFAESVPPAP